MDPSGLSYFCQSSQPKWSAFRDPSFGFSAISFLSDTTATFKWYRNIDQTPGSATLSAIDQTSFTKYAGQCTGNIPALSQVDPLSPPYDQCPFSRQSFFALSSREPPSLHPP